MATYQLAIVTPNGKFLDKQVTYLKAPGASGSFGVLAKHAPMVAQLNAGVLDVKDEGGEVIYAIGPGVLEVDEKSNVLLLSDVIEVAKDPSEAQEKVKQILNQKSS